jgi:hypothetical protein
VVMKRPKTSVFGQAPWHCGASRRLCGGNVLPSRGHGFENHVNARSAFYLDRY